MNLTNRLSENLSMDSQESGNTDLVPIEEMEEWKEKYTTLGIEFEDFKAKIDQKLEQMRVNMNDEIKLQSQIPEPRSARMHTRERSIIDVLNLEINENIPSYVSPNNSNRRIKKLQITPNSHIQSDFEVVAKSSKDESKEVNKPVDKMLTFGEEGEGRKQVSPVQSLVTTEVEIPDIEEANEDRLSEPNINPFEQGQNQIGNESGQENEELEGAESENRIYEIAEASPKGSPSPLSVSNNEKISLSEDQMMNSEDALRDEECQAPEEYETKLEAARQFYEILGEQDDLMKDFADTMARKLVSRLSKGLRRGVNQEADFDGERAQIRIKQGKFSDFRKNPNTEQIQIYSIADSESQNFNEIKEPNTRINIFESERSRIDSIDVNNFQNIGRFENPKEGQTLQPGHRLARRRTNFVKADNSLKVSKRPHRKSMNISQSFNISQNDEEIREELESQGDEGQSGAKEGDQIEEGQYLSGAELDHDPRAFGKSKFKRFSRTTGQKDKHSENEDSYQLSSESEKIAVFDGGNDSKAETEENKGELSIALKEMMERMNWQLLEGFKGKLKENHGLVNRELDDIRFNYGEKMEELENIFQKSRDITYLELPRREDEIDLANLYELFYLDLLNL